MAASDAFTSDALAIALPNFENAFKFTFIIPIVIPFLSANACGPSVLCIALFCTIAPNAFSLGLPGGGLTQAERRLRALYPVFPSLPTRIALGVMRGRCGWHNAATLAG